MTTSFQVLSDAPTLEDVCEQLPTLERYVIIMYDRSNTCKEVNEARRDLFTRKGRHIEGIPPTADALRLHTKRCAYQAGHCWGKALVPSHPLSCPSERGWVRSASQVWEPLFMTLPEASQSCQELLKCGCKSDKGCTRRCKCVRSELQCTALCNCSGLCERDESTGS